MRILVVAVVGIAVAASVGWFASEQHYKNCVTAAIAQTPLQREANPWGGNPIDTYLGADVRARKDAIGACSRMP